jgi:hypothetical protein
MFPKDECQGCGHIYEHHRHGLVAPCEVRRCECVDFVDEQQVAYMGI